MLEIKTKDFFYFAASNVQCFVHVQNWAQTERNVHSVHRKRSCIALLRSVGEVVAGRHFIKPKEKASTKTLKTIETLGNKHAKEKTKETNTKNKGHIISLVLVSQLQIKKNASEKKKKKTTHTKTYKNNRKSPNNREKHIKPRKKKQQKTQKKTQKTQKTQTQKHTKKWFRLNAGWLPEVHRPESTDDLGGRV